MSSYDDPDVRQMRERAERALHSNARWIKTPPGGTSRDRRPGTREVDQLACDVLGLLAERDRLWEQLVAARQALEVIANGEYADTAENVACAALGAGADPVEGAP